MIVELRNGEMIRGTQPFYEIGFLHRANPQDKIRVSTGGVSYRLIDEGLLFPNHTLQTVADLGQPAIKGSRRYALIPLTPPGDQIILVGGKFTSESGFLSEALDLDEKATTGELLEVLNNGDWRTLFYEVAYLAKLKPSQRVASTWFNAYSDATGTHRPHRRLVVNVDGQLERVKVNEAAWEKIAAGDLSSLVRRPTPSFWKRRLEEFKGFL